MVLVLKLGLSSLASGSDGLRVVPVEGARGLSVVATVRQSDRKSHGSPSPSELGGNVQLGAILIVAGNQQGNTEGTGHDALLSVRTLSEAQGEVADGLGARFDAEGLVVVE